VVFVFFFQAEDGIRDFHVTGVQTCALPISPSAETPSAPSANSADGPSKTWPREPKDHGPTCPAWKTGSAPRPASQCTASPTPSRSRSTTSSHPGRRHDRRPPDPSPPSPARRRNRHPLRRARRMGQPARHRRHRPRAVAPGRTEPNPQRQRLEPSATRSAAPPSRRHPRRSHCRRSGLKTHTPPPGRHPSGGHDTSSSSRRGISMTIVHHDQHATTIVDLPTRDETLDPTGRVAPEITYTVEPLRWHGYTVWEWHLNDPTMS